MNQKQTFEPDPVRRHTDSKTLARIERQTEASIRFYATQPHAAIAGRIEELDREWDIERWLETNAATLAFTGAALGLFVDKKWLWLTLGVSGFLLQHATTGWCPPLPILRRQGVRTRSEIDREKFALKTLRGDFEHVPRPPHLEEIPSAEVLEAIGR